MPPPLPRERTPRRLGLHPRPVVPNAELDIGVEIGAGDLHPAAFLSRFDSVPDGFSTSG